MNDQLARTAWHHALAGKDEPIDEQVETPPFALHEAHRLTAPHYLEQQRLRQRVRLRHLLPIPFPVGIFAQPDLRGVPARRSEPEIVRDIDKCAVRPRPLHRIPKPRLDGAV